MTPDLVAEFAAAGKVEVADLFDRLGLMAGYDIEVDDGVGTEATVVTGRITGHRGDPFDQPVAYRFDEQALDRYLAETEATAVDAYGGGSRRSPGDESVDPRVAARQLLNVNLDEELSLAYRKPIDEIGVDRRRGWYVAQPDSTNAGAPQYEQRSGSDFHWSTEPGLP